MFRKLYMALVALSLTSCVVVSPSTLPSDVGNKPLEKYGVVFGSIGEDRGNGGFSAQGIYYRKVGSKESGQFFFGNNGVRDTPKDFTNGKIMGSVFIARLPPGEYEVYNLYFFENRAQFGTATFTAKQDFSVHFTVKEGKPVYLGEFLGRRLTGKNIFRIRITGGGYFVVSNKLERDVSLLRARGEAVSKDSESLVPLFLGLNHELLRDKADLDDL